MGDPSGDDGGPKGDRGPGHGTGIDVGRRRADGGRAGGLRRVVVLACGEAERGDDAAALVVLERLASGGPGRDGHAGIRAEPVPSTAIADGRIVLRPVGALEPEHLLDLGDAACIVADCVVGIPPGEVVVRTLAELLPATPERPGGPDLGDGPPGSGTPRMTARSTHLLPLPDVLALVALVRPGLPHGVFVGIGGAEFGLGRPLSAHVELALPAFGDAIAAQAEALLRDDA